MRFDNAAAADAAVRNADGLYVCGQRISVIMAKPRPPPRSIGVGDDRFRDDHGAYNVQARYQCEISLLHFSSHFVCEEL